MVDQHVNGATNVGAGDADVFFSFVREQREAPLERHSARLSSSQHRERDRQLQDGGVARRAVVSKAAQLGYACTQCEGSFDRGSS
jgi:hypothetical protein